MGGGGQALSEKQWQGQGKRRDMEKVRERGGAGCVIGRPARPERGERGGAERSGQAGQEVR